MCKSVFIPSIVAECSSFSCLWLCVWVLFFLSQILLVVAEKKSEPLKIAKDNVLEFFQVIVNIPIMNINIVVFKSARLFL